MVRSTPGSKSPWAVRGKPAASHQSSTQLKTFPTMSSAPYDYAPVGKLPTGDVQGNTSSCSGLRPPKAAVC